jgi:hypothetical protein
MESSTLKVLLIITALTADSIMLYNNIQSSMEKLNQQFNNIMTQTIGFLDNAWETAKKFQDPNYNYNASELGNFTIPELHVINPTETNSTGNP